MIHPSKAVSSPKKKKRKEEKKKRRNCPHLLGWDVDGLGPCLPDELVYQANVRECTTSHHLMVAATSTVTVEILGRNAIGKEKGERERGKEEGRKREGGAT
tara:strand:+ start:583 stop:885 length:303 start_codon:yes stop_codon:yes gene_type:complete